MQTGKIHIWNMALGYIGTRNVASEQEKTPEAQQCALYWDAARREALRDYPWNWAQCRAILAQKPLPAEWQQDFSRAYALPNKCLKLHRVYPGQGICAVFPVRRQEPFRIVFDQEGGAPIVLTNATGAIAEYTADVEEPARWDDLFVQLMARRLACLICIPLFKNNANKVRELEQLYRAAIPPAYEASASEQVDRHEEDSWILARG